RVSRGSNNEVIVTLDGPTQKTMGLETEALKALEMPREVRGYGRVLDSSALASSVAEVKAAQATSQASQSELARLKNLAGQTNASQRALEAAESAALRDQAQMQASILKLTGAWGNVIAQRSDLLSFAQSLAIQESALAQITLPTGERPLEIPTG